MTSSRWWKVVLYVCLAGCAGSGSAQRSEDGPQPAALTGEEACSDPSALVLLCGERTCAFYRCQAIALLGSAPLEGALRGEVVLVRGVFAEGSVGSPMRWWGPLPMGPGNAEPVFVISWKQPPTSLLPPEVRLEAERRALLPHARHHLFPPGAEFRAWFASKGIAPEAWTMPVLAEDYFRVHAGAQGGLWNGAWRELMQARPEATPSEVWSYAGELCLRFGIFEPVFAGLPPVTPLRITGEETVVRHVELDPATRAGVDKALAECAGLASKEVLARRMNGRNPTHRECLEQVGRDAKGQPITRAMQLGFEMHQVALVCAREKLRELHVLGFSIEPRYRYNPQTGRTTPVSPELEQALLRQGLGSELLGTIVPDVVLHTGNPARVQEVYDFKFPCVDTGRIPPWREYPDGHPFQGENQGDIYKKALGGLPARVAPREGVIR